MRKIQLLFAALFLTAAVNAQTGQLAAYKTAIDTAVTNKNGVGTITPAGLGTLLKQGVDVISAAGVVDTLNRIQSRYRADSMNNRILRTYNVTDYGYVPDTSASKKAQNTAALMSAIAAGAAYGNATITIPVGYGGLNPVVLPKYLTQPSDDGVGYRRIRIQGSGTQKLFGTIGSLGIPNHGTVLCCNSTTPGASIFSGPQGSTVNDYSAVLIELDNIEFRAYDNPFINGVDLAYCGQAYVTNCFIGTGVYNVSASMPTHNTFGLRLPGIDNGGNTYVNQNIITGFYTGIWGGEHMSAPYNNIASCYRGLYLPTVNHDISIGRICCQRCPYPVAAEGNCYFTIDDLDIEFVGANQPSSWQNLISLVTDLGGNSHGQIHYHAVEGGFGPNLSLSKMNIRVNQSRIQVQPHGTPFTRYNNTLDSTLFTAANGWSFGAGFQGGTGSGVIDATDADGLTKIHLKNGSGGYASLLKNFRIDAGEKLAVEINYHIISDSMAIYQYTSPTVFKKLGGSGSYAFTLTAFSTNDTGQNIVFSMLNAGEGYIRSIKITNLVDGKQQYIGTPILGTNNSDYYTPIWKNGQVSFLPTFTSKP